MLKDRYRIDIRVQKIRTNFLGSLVATTDWGKIQIRGKVLPQPGLPWTVTFHTKEIKAEIPLHQLSERFPKIPDLKGAVSADGTLGGILRPKPILQHWSIRAHTERMVWKQNDMLIPFSAEVVLSPEQIRLVSVKIRSAVFVKGNIETPWTNPHVMLTARANKASISKLLTAFSQDASKSLAGGTISFLCEIKGSLTNPSVKGNVSLNPIYGKVVIPSLEGTFSVEDKKLLASADFSKGRVEVTRQFSGNDFAVWSVAMSDVSLAKAAQVNGWDNVNGRLNARLDIDTAQTSPSVAGNMDIEGFEWGRFRANERVDGRVTIDRKRIDFTSDALVLNAMIADNIVKLSNFKLDFGRGSRVAASGTIDSKEKLMDILVDGANIPPDLWPPLVSRYPMITGSMDVRGSMKGAWSGPQSTGDISFKNLKFVPSGGAWSGQAKINGSPDNVALKDIRIAGGYSGELTWASLRKNPRVQAKLSLQAANPQLLLDIIKSTAVVSGKLDGNADLLFRDALPVGVASFTWTNGGIQTFSFNELRTSMKFSGENVTLSEFSLSQDARAIHGVGEAQFKTNHWYFTSNIQFQHWGTNSFAVDGETIVTGRVGWPDLSIESKISAPLLWVNDFSVENITAKITREGPQWKLDGSTEKAIEFNGDFNQESEYLKGSVHAKNVRIEEILSRFSLPQKNIPKGVGNVTATFAGKLGEIDSKAKVDFSDVEWRKEKFDVTASIKVSSSAILISECRGHLVKGGTFSLAGAISRVSESSSHLAGEGKDLNLQSVFHLLDWPAKWEGESNATFRVSGPSNNLVYGIAFDGHHDGFGPFPLGGSLKGQITGRGGQWDLAGIRAESGDGYLALLPGSKIYLERNGAGTMQIIADSRNLRAGLLSFFGGAEVTGSWKSNSENPAEPHSPIELDIFARSLWVNQYTLDGNVTHLTLKPGKVEFSPIVGSGQQLSGVMVYADYPTLEMNDFKLTDNGTEKCFLNGFIGPDKWDYNLRLHHFDAGIMRSLFDTTMPISGFMDAELKGSGNLKNPVLAGDVSLADGRFDALPIDSAQAKLNYKNDILEIKDLKATRKKGYVLSGRFRIGLHSDEKKAIPPEMDLVVEKGDLAMLQDMWPDITKARGSFTARFQMGTRSWGRSVSGYLIAEKVLIQSAYTPSLSKGELKIRLDKNRLHVEQAHAKLGDGNLALTGYVDFTEGMPDFYNLSLRSEGENGISIRVPQLSISPGPFLGQFGILKRRLAGSSRGEPLVNLLLKGPASAPLLAGTIELENTFFTYPPTASLGYEKKNTAFRRWFKDFQEKLRWDVSLVAGSRTWYQNELVDANVTGNIHFVGNTNDMDVSGRINTQQGSIVYSGNEFRIKEATLELETKSPAIEDTSSKHVYVYLKATAEKDVYYTDGLSNNNQDTIVMVVDRSLMGEIQPRFYSRYNPNLSSQRALQLALGLPLSESVDTNSLLPDQRATHQNEKEDNDKLLRLGLVQLLDSSLASPLARALARNTGLVDVIRISYQGDDPNIANEVPVGDQASSNNITQNQFLKYAKGTKVKFGRGLSSRLFADYSVRVDEYQNQVDLRHEVELSYQLKRNLYLRGISELDNEHQLGRAPDRRAILENQWRFGLPKNKKPKTPRDTKGSLVPAKSATKPT